MAKDTSDKKVPPVLTRYERVKEILNNAAGESCSNYQGYERFWNLPLAELLEVTIYGIRMIAPPSGAPTGTAATPSAHSCCHQPAAATTSVAESTPGRGAASGLIKGLRGQFPFDGTQFPPLPWGGKRVAENDIQFIEKWIDDGCPESDGGLLSMVASQNELRSALALGKAEHQQTQGPVNQFFDDAGTLKVRRNIEFLTANELQRFRNAIARMKSFDQFFQDERSFGYWARLHGNLCQHGWEEFLTWHRAYLYFFELQLQDFDSTVTLPYWDWPYYKVDVEKSIEDMGSAVGLDNGVVPEAYRCWLDEQGLQNLAAGKVVPKSVLDNLQKVLGQKFDSGNRLFLAANVKYGQDPASDQAIMHELARINPLWHQQRWPGGSKNLIFEAYPSPDDIERILQLDNFFSFGSGPSNDHFFGALENIHNLIHNFSGGLNPNYKTGGNPMDFNEPQAGHMVNAGVTAYDPIFWGHHSNVDRLWAAWQKLHSRVNPDNPTAILTPWTLNVQDTYSTAALGYEYMLATHVFPTDNTLAIHKFNSAGIGKHPRMLAQHKHAQVRLHRVQYINNPGFHIRVFLNSPNADVNTPTTGNERYVTTFHMFTGLCIGGPGHCDLPQETDNKFDKRPRRHKTPGNFRADATQTVRNLMAKGENDFRVNLVVLNTDGTPASDALKMDAVSLNFTD